MTAPRAVILAAGIGSRMGALTADKPKPLLTIGGQTLLERQLEQLARAGVAEVTVVAGHHRDAVDAVASSIDAPSVAVVENEIFATSGSARSLVEAAACFDGDGDVLITHGDIAVDGRIVLSVVGETGTVFAADRTWERRTGDEVLIWSREGSPRGLVKGGQPPQGSRSGEFIGVSKLDPEFGREFIAYCRRRVADDVTVNYELPVLSDFLGTTPSGGRVRYFADLPWININHPEDLELGSQLLAGSET